MLKFKCLFSFTNVIFSYVMGVCWCVCVHARVCACTCTQELYASGCWRKKSDTLELELWVAVSQFMWGPGTGLMSPGREAV